MESANEGVVLVVDDEPVHLSRMSRGLEAAGYRVFVAESGLRALELVRAEDIDAVLLDVMMPVMSGLETLRAIRQTASPSRLPVLMVTSNERSDDVLEALELGANDYVTKPVELAVAVARIRTHVTTRRAERARRQSEERLAALAAGAQDGLWDWHVETGDLFFSSRWKSVMGWEAETSPPSLDAWLARVHVDDRARVRAELAAHVDGVTTRLESEHRMTHPDGAHRWVLVRGQALRNDGRAVRVAGSLTDVTSQRITDPLTGLPNREVCLLRLGGLLQQSQRDAEPPFAVISLDIDHFTLVNDSLGHVAGDHILSEVAGRLAACLRGTDTVARERGAAGAPVLARCGGDEFTILLEDLAHADDAVRVASRLLEVLTPPFIVQGKQMCLSASLGIAHGSAQARDANDVLSQADAAMHRAKRHGGRRYEIFDAAVHEEAQRRLLLETDLRWAVERDELVLHFEPVVDVASGGLVGFAAEARWQRPGLGLIRIDEIRDAAQAAGMASAIDRWTLHAACTQMAAWQASLPEPPFISVHVSASPEMLTTPSVPGDVTTVIAATGIDPVRLTLDVPCRLLDAASESVVRTLTALRDLGVRIGLTQSGDESPLGSLTRFPFSVLTLGGDAAALDEQATDAFESLCAVLGVARSLSMVTHADRIDTPEQLQRARTLGVEAARGELFGAALDAAAAEALLTSGWRYTPRLSLTA